MYTTRQQNQKLKTASRDDDFIRAENLIQETTEYDKFSFLSNNRDVDPRKKEELRVAMKSYPMIRRFIPLIVNEKLEIVDGQHRFEISREEGWPIYYVVVRGIGVEVARSMNMVGHRWTPEDYAQSFAKEGNKSYQIYLECREDYGLPHSVTIASLRGGQSKGQNAEFKRGEFIVENEAVGRQRLERIVEVDSLCPITMSSPFAYALLTVFKSDQFDYAKFRGKLQGRGQGFIRHYGKTRDYTSMIEDIYNVYAQNKVRF